MSTTPDLQVTLTADAIPFLEGILDVYAHALRCAHLGPPRYVALTADLSDIERLLVIDAHDRGRRPGLDGYTVAEFNETRRAEDREPLPDMPAPGAERVRWLAERLAHDVDADLPLRAERGPILGYHATEVIVDEIAGWSGQ